MTEVQKKCVVAMYANCLIKNITNWGEIPTLTPGNIHKPFIVLELFFDESKKTIKGSEHENLSRAQLCLFYLYNDI